MKPLEIKILTHLNENVKLRFCRILERIEPQKRARGLAGVKMTHALHNLRLQELVTRKYVDRESWYRITDKGRAALRKSQAATEVSSEKLNGFANCEVVLSSDGETDASIYWNGPIDTFTKDQISDILAKHPGIKILGHTKKE